MPKLVARSPAAAAQHNLAAIFVTMLLLLGGGIAGHAVWRRRRLRRDAVRGYRQDRAILLHARQQQEQQTAALQLSADFHMASFAAVKGRDCQAEAGKTSPAGSLALRRAWQSAAAWHRDAATRCSAGSSGAPAMIAAQDSYCRRCSWSSDGERGSKANRCGTMGSSRSTTTVDLSAGIRCGGGGWVGSSDSCV